MVIEIQQCSKIRLVCPHAQVNEGILVHEGYYLSEVKDFVEGDTGA